MKLNQILTLVVVTLLFTSIHASGSQDHFEDATKIVSDAIANAKLQDPEVINILYTIRNVLEKGVSVIQDVQSRNPKSPCFSSERRPGYAKMITPLGYHDPDDIRPTIHLCMSRSQMPAQQMVHEMVHLVQRFARGQPPSFMDECQADLVSIVAVIAADYPYGNPGSYDCPADYRARIWRAFKP